MDDDPWWRDLRVAMGAGDADGVVRLLEGGLPTDGLQLAGDGLLLALGGDADAVELSRRCAEALDERSWDGDVELASALRAATGDTAATALSALPVDSMSWPTCSTGRRARLTVGSIASPARFGRRLRRLRPGGWRRSDRCR